MYLKKKKYIMHYGLNIVINLSLQVYISGWFCFLPKNCYF